MIAALQAVKMGCKKHVFLHPDFLLEHKKKLIIY